MEERTPLDLVDYTDGDLENSLRNVFVDKNAEYIVCDGDTNRSKFLRFEGIKVLFPYVPTIVLIKMIFWATFRYNCRKYL